ncbi:MAG: SpoIIE family protein phosphatase [Bacillota bacterium]
MNRLTTMIDTFSLNKYGEELCGDQVEIITRQDDTKIIVLSDGLGSGVKANILSTLSAKMIATMLAENMSLESCVETMIHTLPICKERGLAYSTFTILHLLNDHTLEVINYDNPRVIILRDGKALDVNEVTFIIKEKKVTKSRIELQENDMIIALSDGCVHAGVGASLNYGWQRQNIIDFLEHMYIPSYSPKTMTKLLIDECHALYEQEPGDDTTVVCLKINKKEVVNVLIGPPEDKENDEKMLGLFFAKKGKHVVCGGTTSQMVSNYLNQPLKLSLNYDDINIPPTATIKGIDLVTEGILTINKVLEYAKDYTDDNTLFNDFIMNEDGASSLARMLFEDATNINFYVGKAVNPAHQNPNLPINFNIKMQLINSLIDHLKSMGKDTSINYF